MTDDKWLEEHEKFLKKMRNMSRFMLDDLKENRKDLDKLERKWSNKK